MIAARLLSSWNGLVESIALLAIIALALCVMVGAVKFADILRHLGAILGFMILLIMLPAIIVGLWATMSFWQHLAVVSIGVALLFLIGSPHRKSGKESRKRIHQD